MSTPSLASAGLRPALPPTLQPNAIAAMAPRASRGLSVFLAVGCSALLGDIGFLAAQLRGVEPAPPLTLVTHGVIDIRGEPAPVKPAPTTPPRAAQPAPSEPAIPESQTKTAAVDPVPVTPDHFSTTNNSLNPTGDQTSHPATPGDPRAATGRIGGPTGSFHGTGTMEIASASVRILSQVQPTYPTMAKKARIQGPVVLRMTIDAQGIPTDVQVASGHPALQAEAVRAARLWRFVPATVDGLPTAATFQLTILFSLR